MIQEHQKLQKKSTNETQSKKRVSFSNEKDGTNINARINKRNRPRRSCANY